MAKRYNYVRPAAQLDVSGGVQTATSHILKKANELASAKNAVFHKKIGSATRRDGYEQVGRTIQAGNDGLGLHIYKYFGNNKIVAGINNGSGSNATLQVLDAADYWTTILSTAAPSTRFSLTDYLDELYVAGFASDTNTYQTLTNIDSTLTPSTTRNVAFAPKAKFVTDFQNGLVAINCEVAGVKHPDRFYISSPAIGAITFVQNDQQGLLQELKTDSAQYLKAGMSVDIYSAGTNAKIVTALQIVTVNKSRNIITFAATQLNVKDNDELWLTGRKDQLSILWNTDYPTPESADFKRIPPGIEEDASIAAYGKNNNRLLIFTKNSTWKFDGLNLVDISQTIGCVAPESVANIGGWTLWLHNTGVWGYNDATGQLKLLSRSVENYIRAINQATIAKASAVVIGRIYKLSVGEIAVDLDASTTSTSTSSTSTSSTSSSTSSTSTSSTSTSSTSTSTTNTTTSTSSTSTSSTSTSTSSTSNSTSTSSTSTSISTSTTVTTTIASTKQVLRLLYDFDSNTWAPEYHTREHRFQITHTMHGYTKPYFIDEIGRLWRDETGSLDGVDTIPFEVEMGRNTFGTPLNKYFVGAIIHTEKARGAQIMVSIDQGQFKDMGQVNADMTEIKFPMNTDGRDINYKIVHNDAGDAPVFNGVTTYFSIEEYSPA